MNQTLLVIAKDMQSFESWVRKWGTRLKNIQFTPAIKPEDLDGWDSKTTFYTHIKGSEKKKGVVRAAISSGLRYVPQENFEERVKKMNPVKGPVT